MKRFRRFLTMLIAPAFIMTTLSATATQAAAAPGPAHLWITALGDSVASGEGTNYGWSYVHTSAKPFGKWVPANLSPAWQNSATGGQKCHVSSNGYPYKVAAKITALRSGGSPTYILNDYACSGATARLGVLGRQPFADGTAASFPQLGGAGYYPPPAHYRDPSPDVVTLTLGANDIHFADVVTRCYARISPCDLDKNLQAQMTADLKQQKLDLDRVLKEITSRPTTDGTTPFIVVTTYYDPFPASRPSGCVDIDPAIPPWNLSAGEMVWLKLSLLQLNNNIRAVARQHPGNVKLVDLESAFRGHEWCTGAPWVYGASIAALWNYPGNPSPFHPTPAGQAAIADRVTAAIRAHFHF